MCVQLLHIPKYIKVAVCQIEVSEVSLFEAFPITFVFWMNTMVIDELKITQLQFNMYV